MTFAIATRTSDSPFVEAVWRTRSVSAGSFMWNNTTVITGDVVDAIKQLKAQAGRDIVQYGFGQLSYMLMDHALLDELRLWVHPFFVRKGGLEDLLYREGPLTMLNLVSATTLESGIVILTYEGRNSTSAKSE